MRAPARRGSDPSWMRPITERLSPVIRTLIIVDALLFAFYAVVKEVQPLFQQHLALTPATLRGELWQPITALFVHLDFLSFLFNVIGLWFVGATMERLLGTRRFLVLFFATGIAANLAMVLVSAALGMPQIYAGCGIPVLGLFVAFGVHYGRTPARVLGGLVVEARYLSAALVGFALLADLMRGAWPALAGDIVGVLVAFALGGGRIGNLRGGWTRWRAARVRRKYQVLDGGKRGKRASSSDDRPTILN